MSSSAEANLSLADLEGWLRLCMTTPGGLAAGLVKARERYGDASPIRVRDGVDPRERLSIYARGYLARLSACLVADYPAVRALVGDALFERFATGYLWARPPRGYSLFDLGCGFADHLERTRPPDSAVPEERRSLLGLPIDLARVERARLEAMRAPGLEREGGDRGDLDALSSLLGGSLRVAAAPCLRVVALGHDVRGFLLAVDRGERPPVPEARACVLALSRVDFRPTLTELSPWQAKALSGCGSPRALVELAEGISAALGESRGAALADLLLWLPTARGLGLVSVSSSSSLAP